MKYFFIIIQLFLSTVIDAQIITTASGNGLPGDTGDSGPATSAKIDYPTLNVFDAQGNYYFTENSNKVRKVTPDGIISTIAGTGIAGFAGDSGLATSAKLNGPIGIGIDKIGNIYINDCQNNRIRKIDATTGIITTYAGNGTAGFSGDSGLATAASINGAADVACDTFGNVYISDHGNNRIRKVDTAGIITTVAGNGIGAYGGTGGRADTTKISLPVGITCDLTGNLYFVEEK